MFLPVHLQCQSATKALQPLIVDRHLQYLGAAFEIHDHVRVHREKCEHESQSCQQSPLCQQAGFRQGLQSSLIVFVITAMHRHAAVALQRLMQSLRGRMAGFQLQQSFHQHFEAIRFPLLLHFANVEPELISLGLTGACLAEQLFQLIGPPGWRHVIEQLLAAGVIGFAEQLLGRLQHRRDASGAECSGFGSGGRQFFSGPLTDLPSRRSHLVRQQFKLMDCCGILTAFQQIFHLPLTQLDCVSGHLPLAGPAGLVDDRGAGLCSQQFLQPQDHIRH